MSVKETPEAHPVRIRTYASLLAVGWTIAAGASFLWINHHEEQQTLDMARVEARTAYEKDVIMRRWATEHGGVYAPVTEQTPPNPYLKVPEREITTPSGRTLTLINPAYMTRQVHELGAAKHAVYGHITSLRPIRPGNAPDPWETQALAAFEKGAEEVSGLDERNGETHMRLMRPLITEEGCLQCHAENGYELGDIRGGISVSLPMAPLWALERDRMRKEAMGHAALWLLGLVGIGFGAGRLERRVREQRRVEKALRESEEEYRAIFDSAGDSLLLVEPQGRIVDANPRACAAYGYSQGELLELNARDIAHPDHRDRRDRMLADMEGRGEAQMQTVDVRKDGQSVQVEIRGVRLDYKGRPHLLLIVRDVSERVRAEAERRQLESQLLHLQKMEAIGTLAGGVAHDLNNILSGIVGYPDLVLRQVADDSPLRKPIQIIQKSGQKAADIVQSLLALASRGSVDTEVVSLNAIATELLQSPEMEQLRAIHPNVRFETHLNPSLLNLEGSPAHLSKALMNLLSHAAEAMPGGGAARISTSNRYLDRSVKVIGYEEAREGEYVVVQVSDTGLVLAPRDLERIFEPFYTKRVLGRGGVGIGMAVVWGTVKDHRGYVDARSAEGEGTTYTLYFPATRQEVSEGQPHLSLEECVGSGESILVVDDMEQQRDLACDMLRQLNYRVEAVASGEEAVELLKSRPVDLLILDMIMDPGIDGLETYKQILKRHPEQRAVIVSGYSETERVREARRLGAGAYVRKPYLLETIGRAVRGELGRERGREPGS